MNLECSIWVGDLAAYNAGKLVGEWINLVKDGIETALEYVGSHEYYIADVETNIKGLYNAIGEYSSLTKIGELIERISNLDEWSLETLDYASRMEPPRNIDAMEEIIDKLDEYTIIDDCESDYDLGYYYIHDAGIYDLDKMGQLANYIDYKAFGRDIRLESMCEYIDGKCIMRNW